MSSLKYAPEKLFFVELPVNLSRDMRVQLAYVFALENLSASYDYDAVTGGNPSPSEYCIRLASALLGITNMVDAATDIRSLSSDAVIELVEEFVRKFLSQSGTEAFYDFLFKQGTSAVNAVMALEVGILSHMIDVALKEAIENNKLS